jgi:hypothetical protein
MEHPGCQETLLDLIITCQLSSIDDGIAGYVGPYALPKTCQTFLPVTRSSTLALQVHQLQLPILWHSTSHHRF